MAVSELTKEAAERRKGLNDLAKVVRNRAKALTTLLNLIKRIVKRKSGLPSLSDLAAILKALDELIKSFTGLASWAKTLTDIFKIIG